MKQYQEIENGSYLIDGMSIPAADSNRHYRQMLAEVEASEAEILPYIEPEPTPADLKLVGVEFEGVMCSATAEDMWGLNAVEDWITAGQSVPFKFENGNVLLLTPDNVEAFKAVWISFRASFFEV